MSIFEQAIRVISNDYKALAGLWSNRIINADLSHGDYIVAKSTYNTLNDANIIIGNAIEFIAKNPDSELPKTFIPGAPGTADPEEQESGSTIHTVDIESGAVSQGSN